MKNIQKEFEKFGFDLLSYTQNDKTDKIEEIWFGNGKQSILMENTGNVLFIQEGKSATNNIPSYLNKTVQLSLYELFEINYTYETMISTIRIPTKMKKEIKLKCIDNGKNLTDALNYIIENFQDFNIENLKLSNYKNIYNNEFTKINFRTNKINYKNFKLYCVENDLEITYFILSALNDNLDYILNSLN